MRTLFISLISILGLMVGGAQANPKYAAYVVDVDTGRVFYEKNANKRRYPASLTKMMTLYMTFEALRKGKLRMNQRLPVSKRAASQPQTNISLKPGSKITVKQLIESLVVRSANDASVVLAEAIGGTEWNFAVQMTAKARQLGLRNTVFKNPHGLPNAKQYTTAKDMAMLGIALRRDFPQYYDFFDNTRFTYNGRTYTSHNKVLKRMRGADGIKTGYIRASGFNLVTSIKRDGYRLLGVVMGGKSGKSRDDHMVSLLGRSFAQLEKEGDRPRQFASVPTPERKPNFTTPLARASITPTLREVSATKQTASQTNTGRTSTTKIASVRNVSSATQQVTPIISKVSNTVSSRALDKKSPFKLASLNSGGFQAKPGSWGIQVGAYRNEKDAFRAAAQAVRLAQTMLKDSKIAITDRNNEARTIHRARLANLSEYQARQACAVLIEANNACFTFKFDERGRL